MKGLLWNWKNTYKSWNTIYLHSFIWKKERNKQKNRKKKYSERGENYTVCLYLVPVHWIHLITKTDSISPYRVILHQILCILNNIEVQGEVIASLQINQVCKYRNSDFTKKQIPITVNWMAAREIETCRVQLLNQKFLKEFFKMATTYSLEFILLFFIQVMVYWIDHLLIFVTRISS